MKAILFSWCLVAFTLLSPLKSTAQTSVYHPFPTDSAMWSTTVYDYNNSILSNPVSTIYKIKGDSILNGRRYSKVFKGKPYVFNDDTGFKLYSLIYTDTGAKKVYVKYPLNFFGDSSDILLYNFNVLVGDTIPVKVLSQSKLFFETEKTIVKSIDSFQTNTGFRKSIRIEFTRNVFNMSIDSTGMTWVEGIGSLLSPFYTELCDACYQSRLVNLSCFLHDGIDIISNSFGPCYSHPQSINEIPVAKIQVYPNPNKGKQLTLLKPYGASWRQYAIYAINGEIKLQGQLSSGTKEQTIELSDSLTKGIYFLRIEFENNQPVCIKLIII
ncbi:MAG: T9SS type A sorting domain-containing protein [Bacteroidia bacterium]|nr:T9SS type A sorting domain-containing protein [Bacteroidia bacterium]